MWISNSSENICRKIEMDNLHIVKQGVISIPHITHCSRCLSSAKSTYVSSYRKKRISIERIPFWRSFHSSIKVNYNEIYMLKRSLPFLPIYKAVERRIPFWILSLLSQNYHFFLFKKLRKIILHFLEIFRFIHCE